MDWEKARFNMVEQQVRTWEVFDLRVLDTLLKVPREHFVPPAMKALAFADVELPLPCGERMLRPVVEAKALQALQLRPSDRVLEIGTGSGWFAACLAHLAAEVVTVERHGELAEYAWSRLQSLQVSNARVVHATCTGDWEDGAPFDVIVLSGGLTAEPRALRQRLTPGGRMLAFVGTPTVMSVELVHCVTPGVYRREQIFETVVPMLADFAGETVEEMA